MRFMNMHTLSFCLTLFGLLGLSVFIVIGGVVLYFYRGCSEGSFRWHVRNRYLKQVSALICLFCLAMAASYSLLTEAWALLYFVLACKAGTWWLRIVIDQHA